MTGAYPGKNFEENRAQGVWPVPSLSSNRYRSFTPELIRAVDDRMPEQRTHLRVLDIGSSYGDSLADLARDLSGQLDVTTQRVGLDINRQALQVARRRGNVDRIVWAIAQQLPFRSDWFDIVIAKNLLSFLRPLDQSQCLEEISRVLAPTGVTVMDIDTDGTEDMHTSNRWVVSATQLGRIRTASNGFTSTPLSLINDLE